MTYFHDILYSLTLLYRKKLKWSLKSILSANQQNFWFKFSPHGDHKANVGMNLKFNKKNEEVPGYTKKVGNEWMYSSAAEQLLAEYLER